MGQAQDEVAAVQPPIAEPTTTMEEYDDSHIPEAPADLVERRKEFQKNRATAFEKPVNCSILEAAKGEKPSNGRIPVWAMRQAGRYLPEFKQVRAISSFFEVCRSPRLAAEVTLQPLERYRGSLDAVIIFSDILVIPIAMGMECEMIPGQGPTFKKALNIQDTSDLILKPNIEDTLGYVFDAIHWTYLRLNNEVPVIGFSGAPWTLFAYMIEGSGSKTWNGAKKCFYMYPKETQKILTAITDIIIEYLIGQYDAGASLLQVFDTNAGELCPHIYEKCCVPDLLRIAEEVKAARPDALMTIFAKDADLTPFNDSKYDVVGVSWKQCPLLARKVCPSKTLQGNLDPVVLYSDMIEEEAREMIAKFGPKKYIANLGHGMLPDLTPEGLGRYIKTVKEASLL